ncbi:MAG: hypothetical protein QXI58_06070 [Candidatus Micrarchaeia archaeon]
MQEKFFGEEKRKPSLYEKICNYFGKFEFPLSEKYRKEIQEKLEFCDIVTTPEKIFSSALILIFLSVLISIPLFIFNYSSIGILVIASFIGLSIYLIFYPNLQAKNLRVKASNELIQTILYLVVSLRLIPNLENALFFAASNTSGVVGRKLKKMAWQLKVGKYKNADEVLEKFAQEWKVENLEFYEAIDLIRGSCLQTQERREKMLDEAINLMLNRNMERMMRYARQLRNPLMIITTLGITLPILVIILFPIMVIFLPELINPYVLFIFYDFILPAVVFYIMFEALRSRPITFGIVDISEHPKAKRTDAYAIKIFNKKIFIPTILISTLIGSLIIGIGFYLISIPSGKVSIYKIFGGLTIVAGISCSILIYSFLQFFENIDIKNEIKQIEIEFDEVLFQLGYVLSTGIPLEAGLEKIKGRVRALKIFGLVEGILANIKKFGFTLKKALFDEKYGVVKMYPSRLIKSIMSTISDVIEKGVAGTSKTILSISQYLKSLHNVEEHMREVLDEAISDMRIMMNLLVPISSGATVGLATLMVMVLFQIASLLTSITGLSQRPEFTPENLMFATDIKNIIPAEAFLVCVGIYMLEVTFMLAYFSSTLEHGEDVFERYKLIAQSILISLGIFTFTILFIYFTFAGLIQEVGVIKP